MDQFVSPAPDTVAIPVKDGGLFPVRQVFCVGRNYAAHAREMGGDPDREQPFFFTKPADALVTGGAYVPPGHALVHVWGYAAGLDMTRRDLQDEAKQTRRPWDMSKAFDQSAPLGELVPAAGIDPGGGAIELHVNGAVRQMDDLDQLICSVPDVIAFQSSFVRLEPGDLISTGTPDGVGAVRTRVV